ncbi:MAG: DUF131 domain-containing protein [Thaumarchaeota archaeon]|nr:DUF131 domain-containing protein [Nitrososphaerota archaeon]
MAALGLSLIIIGLLLILVSYASRSGKLRGGGVILIGAFPIIFGDESVKSVAVMLAIFLVIMCALFILMQGLVGVSK